MTRSLFESFYFGNIEKIASEIVLANSEFHYNSNVNGVYEEYLNHRTFLKTLIKGGTDSCSGESIDLLDGHKVAACITCAILKVRLITNSQVGETVEKPYALDKSYRLNEQLAVFSGLSCLYEYMADNTEDLYADDVDKNEDEEIHLILPMTFYKSRSTYLDSLIRALYYSNVYGCVNPMLLSNIFFMIEKYHRQAVKLKRLEHSLSHNS